MYANVFFVYKIIFFLVFASCAHAMDLSILHLTSAMMCDDFEEPKINHFDKLPLDLHSKIVKNIFDLVVYKDEDCKQHLNQEKLEKYVSNMPFFLGIKLTHEFSQFQKICQYKIGFKKFNARQLFVLPHRQRDLFMRIANRSVLEEGDIYVDDKKIIDNMPSDIKKGLRLRVNYLHPALDYTKNASASSIFLWALSYIAVLNMPMRSQCRQKALWVVMLGYFGNLTAYMFCEFLAGLPYDHNGYLKEVKF